MSELGDSEWRLVAYRLRADFGIKGRSGKQCRERWINHLDPNISALAWTDEDENSLFELHKQLGNSWTEISKLLNRTDNSVKNHFYSSVRRNIRDYNKAHIQKIPKNIEIKDLIKDEELSKEILKPNYKAKKRSKPHRECTRKSDCLLYTSPSPRDS